MVHLVKDMDDFDSQLTAAGGKLVVVAPCPCNMVAPHLEEMSETLDDVVFLKVAVDYSVDIAAQYHVFATCCDA